MEIINEINEKRRRYVDDFLSFIPIYEDKKREIALKNLLLKNRKFIKNKICVEAGAGKGIFSKFMVLLGAKRVYAVEESFYLYKILKENVKDEKKIIPVNKKIEDFLPDEEIDLLFQEFYGSLLFDESLLALEKIKFKPKRVIPDGGALWCMILKEKEIMEKDKIYEKNWKEILKNVLVSDLFPYIKFKPHFKIFEWNYGKDFPKFIKFELKRKGDFLVFSSEIKDKGKSILKTWETDTWSLIYTPINGKKFLFEFNYENAFTEIKFKWI